MPMLWTGNNGQRETQAARWHPRGGIVEINRDRSLSHTLRHDQGVGERDVGEDGVEFVASETREDALVNPRP